MVDQPPLCINALAIDKAMAQGPFWTMHTNHRWVYPGTGTLMPFGLGNAVATYQTLQRVILAPRLLGRREEEEEMLGPSERPEPREAADP